MPLMRARPCLRRSFSGGSGASGGSMLDFSFGGARTRSRSMSTVRRDPAELNIMGHEGVVSTEYIIDQLSQAQKDSKVTKLEMEDLVNREGDCKALFKAVQNLLARNDNRAWQYIKFVDTIFICNGDDAQPTELWKLYDQRRQALWDQIGRYAKNKPVMFLVKLQVAEGTTVRVIRELLRVLHGLKILTRIDTGGALYGINKREVPETLADLCSHLDDTFHSSFQQAPSQIPPSVRDMFVFTLSCMTPDSPPINKAIPFLKKCNRRLKRLDPQDASMDPLDRSAHSVQDLDLSPQGETKKVTIGRAATVIAKDLFLKPGQKMMKDIGRTTNKYVVKPTNRALVQPAARMATETANTVLVQPAKAIAGGTQRAANTVLVQPMTRMRSHNSMQHLAGGTQRAANALAGGTQRAANAVFVQPAKAIAGGTQRAANTIAGGTQRAANTVLVQPAKAIAGGTQRAANTIAGGTQRAANTVLVQPARALAGGTQRAANTVLVQPAKALAGGTQRAANTIAGGTQRAANTVLVQPAKAIAGGTQRAANTIAGGTQRAANTVLVQPAKAIAGGAMGLVGLHNKREEQNEELPKSLQHLTGHGRKLWERAQAFRTKCTELADRRFRMQSYKNCFVGVDTVDMMLTHGLAATREDCVQLARYLNQHYQLFKHVSDDQKFCDEYSFYEFISGGGPLKGNRERPRQLDRSSRSLSSGSSRPPTRTKCLSNDNDLSSGKARKRIPRRAKSCCAPSSQPDSRQDAEEKRSSFGSSRGSQAAPARIPRRNRILMRDQGPLPPLAPAPPADSEAQDQQSTNPAIKRQAYRRSKSMNDAISMKRGRPDYDWVLGRPTLAPNKDGNGNPPARASTGSRNLATPIDSYLFEEKNTAETDMPDFRWDKKKPTRRATMTPAPAFAALFDNARSA